MGIRKTVVALFVAAILAGSVSQSNASTPIAVVVAASSTVGASVTAGFIGFVAVICIYDFWLKANGFKNWDGSPKVVQHHHYR